MKPSIGVIVGRFQVPTLHPGHIDLFNEVLKRHDNLVIVLGLSPVRATRANPLDFNSRKQMLEDHFRYIGELNRISFKYVNDEAEDGAWSKNLDKVISGEIERLGNIPKKDVVLYGSRDSFIPHYCGQFSTKILEPRTVRQDVSGTALRESISKNTQASADFRAGVVWAAYHRFPTTFPTVDVAVFTDPGQLLVGRKLNESKWRLPGGFADPNSPSFEHDAIREVREETGLILEKVEYIGSYQIDDWRYRSEVDKIKTLLFIAHHNGNQWDRLAPGDDLHEVTIMDIDNIHMWKWSDADLAELFEAAHVPLIRAVLNNYYNIKVTPQHPYNR